MNQEWFDKVKREHQVSNEHVALKAPHVSLLLDWSAPEGRFLPSNTRFL